MTCVVGRMVFFFFKTQPPAEAVATGWSSGGANPENNIPASPGGTHRTPAGEREEAVAWLAATEGRTSLTNPGGFDIPACPGGIHLTPAGGREETVAWSSATGCTSLTNKGGFDHSRTLGTSSGTERTLEVMADER